MASRGITPQQAQQIKNNKGLPTSKLSLIRLNRGLSQRELAELSGVAERSIKCYEQFDRPIEHAKLHTLYKLCVALNCKLEDILENEEMIGEWHKII